MTRSHKILVLVPPFLIAFTFLLTLFTIQHNRVIAEQAANENFEVTTPVPPINNATLPPRETVACTTDVKECPDGTFVGRVGQNCTFALCPSEIEALGAVEVN